MRDCIMPQQILRLAERPEAVEVVARWHYDEWGIGPEEVGLEVIRRRVADWATGGGIPCGYVAVVDGEVCGSASLVDHDMSDPPAGTAELQPWLSGVYVKPERRKTGLGPALVNAVEDAASALGHTRLYLYTAPVTSVKFYAPMGWVTILSPFYEGRDVVVMQKDLPSVVQT
jgi:GNAT superfamily N-acetyltransferase